MGGEGVGSVEISGEVGRRGRVEGLKAGIGGLMQPDGRNEGVGR